MATDNTPVLVSLRGAADLTSLSTASIVRLRAKGDFPTAVQICDRRIGFMRREVVAWAEARADRRLAA